MIMKVGNEYLCGYHLKWDSSFAVYIKQGHLPWTCTEKNKMMKVSTSLLFWLFFFSSFLLKTEI